MIMMIIRFILRYDTCTKKIEYTECIILLQSETDVCDGEKCLGKLATATKVVNLYACMHIRM